MLRSLLTTAASPSTHRPGALVAVEVSQLRVPGALDDTDAGIVFMQRFFNSGHYARDADCIVHLVNSGAAQTSNGTDFS
jgi:hypothetical protein